MFDKSDSNQLGLENKWASVEMKIHICDISFQQFTSSAGTGGLVTEKHRHSREVGKY